VALVETSLAQLYYTTRERITVASESTVSLVGFACLEAIQAALSNYLISFFGIPIAAILAGRAIETDRHCARNHGAGKHVADHASGL